jgi:lipopolysaccharide transport system permease protein
MFPNLADALSDIRAGLGMWRVWTALAHEDIGDQHRRTLLGPLWLLINYLAFAGTFIFVFTHSRSVENYPAYVATGLLVWFFVMETLTQSLTLFTREESFIKGTRLPLSVYVLRLALQSIIRAGYAFVGCIVILIVSGTPVTLSWAWSLLGIAVILLATPAAIIIFALLGAFFPDSQFMVSNLLRLGMFLTPVFWVHDGSQGIRNIFYWWNPFTYFIEIVRLPIVFGAVSWNAFALCFAICLALWACALALFAHFRRDVVFVI